MTTTEHTEVTTRPRRRGGPPLPAPALAWAGLTVAAAVAFPGAGPSTSPAERVALLTAYPVAGTLSGLLLLASAAPLAVWAAAVYQRLHALGLRVAGPGIGLVGGVLAAGALAASGLLGWAATVVAPLGDAPVVAALTTLAFGAGGAAFVVALALLVAGVAVPSLILGLIPRPLARAGLVVAAVAVPALLSLAIPALAPALPVVRFGGLLWIVAVSFLLPLTRRARA